MAKRLDKKFVAKRDFCKYADWYIITDLIFEALEENKKEPSLENAKEIWRSMLSEMPHLIKETILYQEI